ncbi:protein translocase subunit SecDF [Dinghuibacter silviterrae]|uniref:Multifunctional fusion protein n=1 Tax=Dinghuibacter silviterrae TaxID=1539049 RepID=A0A4R8DTB4_9BACT|nr:protein translocase subunit SecDF [Dinghuibacter silviterrae]TDX01148.1 SecD/SecF fusion protein [Dinghuibacter silviterrae]
MQLKGLVWFFTIALIVISLYQLSFTWIVNSHERQLKAKADRFVKLNYADASADTKDSVFNARYHKLQDSTQDQVIANFLFYKVSYLKAKEQELSLGLDLKGGMSVTLEVGLDGLIRSMSNNPKDSLLNKALALAVQRRANGNADFINLFAQAYKEVNPTGKLAGLFAGASQHKIKVTASDDEVLAAIRDEANQAIDRTNEVITTRIDQFGVAQPNIIPDKAKGDITVELPGVENKERVKKLLQATAKLEFWETYTVDQQFYTQYIAPLDSKLKDYLAGKPLNDTAKTGDTAAKAAADTAQQAFVKANPLLSLLNVTPATTESGRDARTSKASLGFVKASDTATFSEYVNSPAAKAVLPSNLRFLYGAKALKAKNNADILEVFCIKTRPGTEKAELDGEHVTDARQDNDQTTGRVVVSMQMDNIGGRLWEKMTTENVDHAIAIALDGLVYSAPNVEGPIAGGNSQISGNFTPEEAQDLSSILKAGKLAAPARIIASVEVGPTLGAEAISGGLKAFALSFIVIFILMLVYYNTGGWVANIALILNLLFTVGVLTSLGASLTAPGIAGLVLTVGMAVDTNVIIFERIKEELARGRAYPSAVQEGYRRSMPPVLDAHVTTLLTACILLYFGLGPIKGFATTQIIGILLSLFCGILVSRLVTDTYTNRQRHFIYLTKISTRIFKHAAFKFIEYRKVAYGISAVVLILAAYSVFIHGFKYGIEFKGGRSYTVQFSQAPSSNAVFDAVNKEFQPASAPSIKTVGDAKHLDIVTDYMITESGSNIDSLVEHKMYHALIPFLPQGTSYEQFDKVNRLQSQTVLPTISSDLKKGAVKAIIFGLLIIFVYIFIRFRDWRYSLGTIIALLHDVFVTLIVFSLFADIVPFPLEIGQHFIAAVLTVIGYSMNDTVIVFDRIREDSHIMIGASKESIINKAINDTLSRTIMTSLTVFLTILILFIFGGEVTRGFAFAMLIGVITGTYSSIFVAAPVLVDLDRKRGLAEHHAHAPAAAPAKAKTV